MVRGRRGGMTLVELLVVIAIIAMLMALLLPAVQSVRESARITQCRNNLRQVALGAVAFLGSEGFFPGVGRHYGFTGNPDQGLGASQDGGWLFPLLPFVEQMNLFQLGAGETNVGVMRQLRAQRISTPVAIYTCPSRGSALVPLASDWFNTRLIARSDYAASRSGIFSARMRADQVSDGLSNVFLAGERYINPDFYNQQFGANDQGWTVGCDQDTVCRADWQIMQDTRGVQSVVNGGWPSSGGGIAFGAPHAILNMAIADGGVRGVSYQVDPAVFLRIARHRDGGGIDDLGSR